MTVVVGLATFDPAGIAAYVLHGEVKQPFSSSLSFSKPGAENHFVSQLGRDYSPLPVSAPVHDDLSVIRQASWVDEGNASIQFQDASDCRTELAG
jgi:hypothetical protein